MKIALIGHGNMGREIERLASSRNITIGTILDSRNNADAAGLSRKSLKNIDVCIDFSAPAAVIGHIEAAAVCRTNIVVGTTGWYDKLPEMRRLATSRKIGLLYSPNFSIGMNIFTHVLTAALHYVDAFEMYDTALHEVHHRKKADCPSGTALALGEIIIRHLKSKKEILHATPLRALKPEQLHISSSRVGTVAGTHTVTFDSDADTIELIHRAKNRSGFAYGALIAAEWLKGKRGVFTMNDVISSL